MTRSTVAALVLSMVLLIQVDCLTDQIRYAWDSTNLAHPPHLNVTNPAYRYGYNNRVIPCTYYGFIDSQDFNRSQTSACLEGTWPYVGGGNIGLTNEAFVYYYLKPGWYNPMLDVYACYIGCFNLQSPAPGAAPTPNDLTPAPPLTAPPTPASPTPSGAPSVVDGSNLIKSRKSSSLEIAVAFATGVGALLLVSISGIALLRTEAVKSFVTKL